MSKLAIIDADSMIYIIAWKFKTKKVANLVRISLNQFIHELLKASGATHYVGFYGSSDKTTAPNFRFAIDPEYKSNRPETPDFITKWRPTIHAEMSEKWGFVPVSGMEADDAVSIAKNKYAKDYDEIVVITADKDLKQLAGITHFDMNKHKFTPISQLEADKFFVEQLLKGDPGDHIKGLPGTGPKTAAALVEGCKTSSDLKWMVMRMYKNHFDSNEVKLTKTAETDIETEWNTWLDAVKADDKNPIHQMTEKQLERQKRLFITGAAKKRAVEKSNGGWRAYIKQQYQLLRMLDVAPDGFVVPEPVAFAHTIDDTDPEEKTDFLGL